MKKTLVIASLAIWLLPALARADGPVVFKAQKCVDCHSVTAAGIAHDPASGEKPKDLSKIGGAMDKRAIAQFLLKKTERNGEKHKKAFGGTTEELKTLAEWLETLK